MAKAGSSGIQCSGSTLGPSLAAEGRASSFRRIAVLSERLLLCNLFCNLCPIRKSPKPTCSREGNNSQHQLTRPADVIANPSSAPALTRMMLKRRSSQLKSSVPRPGGRAVRASSGSAAAATSKYSGASALWMKRPVQATSPVTIESKSNENYGPTFEAAGFEDSSPAGEACCQASVRLDLQTNNSKREGRWGGGSGPAGSSAASDSVSDYEIVSDISDPMSLDNASAVARGLDNASAVARGADAMVKNSLSRPTEIIDTSKLIEEGKVSTVYIVEPEMIEEQDHAMIDEYEKTFAYARRLRKLLNMQFKELDKASIETNFLMVKAHEHPTQRMIDRWRNVDYGISYNDQVKRQKQIEEFRANAVKKKGKKGDEQEPVYPELIRFTVRFRKENSEKRWKDFMSFRQKQKKMAGNKGGAPAPKPNDKYVFAFQDIWSYCIVVFVKPSATVRDIVEPVFARIGLERRADFTYTIGCFMNDKRAGKAKIIGVPNLPEQLEVYQLASELYKKNCTEIYVNDNRCEMFAIFPDYYTRGMGMDIQAPANSDKEKKKKKGKDKDKGDKNKSNAETNLNANNVVAEGAADEVASLSTLVSATRLLREEADVFEASAAAAAAVATAAEAAAGSVASVSPMSVKRRCLSVVEETSRESLQ